MKSKSNANTVTGGRVPASAMGRPRRAHPNRFTPTATIREITPVSFVLAQAVLAA
ncbi:MAG: hypothetical protein ACR2QO_19805 [Acidimicrobiales bacterium]